MVGRPAFPRRCGTVASQSSAQHAVRAMRRRVRISALILAAAALVGCTEHGPDLDELADRWAEAVCSRWSDCGCPVDDCEAEQRRFFIDRWDDDDRLPVQRCFDERVAAIEDLACAYVEAQPFEWEQAACPLAPTFRGLNEPCEPAAHRETFAGACRTGLVCDAMTRRCLSPVPAPIAGQPCLRSGHDDHDDWLCADGLACDEAGLCVEEEMPERTPPSPLVCDGLLSF